MSSFHCPWTRLDSSKGSLLCFPADFQAVKGDRTLVTSRIEVASVLFPHTFSFFRILLLLVSFGCSQQQQHPTGTISEVGILASRLLTLSIPWSLFQMAIASRGDWRPPLWDISTPPPTQYLSRWSYFLSTRSWKSPPPPTRRRGFEPSNSLRKTSKWPANPFGTWPMVIVLLGNRAYRPRSSIVGLERSGTEVGGGWLFVWGLDAVE